MWNRADVDFIQTQDLPWAPVPPGDFGDRGGLARTLSHDPGDGAVTLLVQFKNDQAGILRSRCDIFVVEGTGSVNGRPFGPGHYLHVPAGAHLDIRAGLPRCVFYMGFWGPAALDPGTVAEASAELEHVDLEAVPWAPPEWSGDRPLDPGVAVKWLRRDETGICFVSCMMPGWRCEDEEAHPVYEESFKVYGDIMMGSRGVMQAGAYFYRSPDIFHGPLYSRSGTMSFIRSDAPTSSVYRPTEAGRSWSDLAAVAYGNYPVGALS